MVFVTDQTPVPVSLGGLTADVEQVSKYTVKPKMLAAMIFSVLSNLHTWAIINISISMLTSVFCYLCLCIITVVCI